MKQDSRKPEGRGPRQPHGRPAPEQTRHREERPQAAGEKPVQRLSYDFRCPVEARCGGCQLSGMAYQEQLRMKRKRTIELLGRFGSVAPIKGMERPYHYRNKVHAVLGTDKSGRPVSGVYAYGTHRLVPVKSCLLEDRRADAIIRDIVAMLPKYKLRIYNEYTHRGFLRHILVRTGHVSGQIMVVLVTTGREFPGGKAFTEELLALHPEITTLVMNINQKETSMVLGSTDVVMYGNGWMEDSLCGRVFRISPQSFYQVNAQQAEVLYQTAIDAAGLTGGETLLDAYCGTGTIGLCASDRIGRLIGVELNADAVKDARENAKRNGVENASFFCDDAGRFMTRMAKEGNHVDVVLMDPPRSGSDEPFLRSVLTLAPDRVVYVSCNPETQARDLELLVQGGYRVESIVPVDMFPGTLHIETVVSMSRQQEPGRRS